MSKGSTFPFDADAFLTGTVEMSNEQAGVYIRLLCFQWTNNGLPNDENILARICFCESNAIASVLHMFPLDPDGKRRNDRLERDRANRDKRSDSQAANAYKRWPKAPKSDEAKKIAEIFRRRLTTEWSDHEIMAFRKIKDAIALPDLDVLHKYYESERSKGDEGRHRRDLITFLNNYHGELDRARQWEATQKRKSSNLNGSHPAKEPEGFMQWVTKTYPTFSMTFQDISPENRRTLMKEFHDSTQQTLNYGQA